MHKINPAPYFPENLFQYNQNLLKLTKTSISEPEKKVLQHK